jgi:type I restriction enzyme, S subunit
MSFPRYPSYKDSDVEWLGEVPGHWAVKRLKRACHAFPSNVDKKVHDGEAPILLCNYTDVYYNERIVAGMEFMAATASTDQIAKFTLRAGDTIITKDSETADDIAIAAHVPADLPGVVCGYHLSMVRPMPETDGAFVKRLFDSGFVKSCVAVRANGLTRVGLGQYEIDNLELPFPPLPEQTQIAAFLDRETAKIDALVAEQRRLMELLKEKRQAVISYAVTKGLNPNAPTKPSGMDWLGDVPEHWELKATKRLFRLVVEPAPDDNDYELLSIYTEIGVRPRKSLEAKGNKATTTDGYWMVQRGDLIVNKLLAWMGAIGISDYDGVTSPAYDILRQTIPLEPRFYDFLFRCGICFTEFRRYSRGIMDMRLRLYFDELGQLLMPYPPEVEQRQIVSFLQDELQRFDALSLEAQRAIDLLQERRAALISAAVTGQIDVRHLSGEIAA